MPLAVTTRFSRGVQTVIALIDWNSRPLRLTSGIELITARRRWDGESTATTRSLPVEAMASAQAFTVYKQWL